MLFFMLINVNMPTVVGILTFIEVVGILTFMSMILFYNLGTCCFPRVSACLLTPFICLKNCKIIDHLLHLTPVCIKSSSNWNFDKNTIYSSNGKGICLAGTERDLDGVA